MSVLQRLLAHPLTRGMDVDDPATTSLRRRIVESKPFLRKIYEEWYGKVLANLPEGPGAVVEIGAGAGFLKSRFPELVASEVFACQGVDAVLDARRLPFAAASVRAIVMTDVLHHIPDVGQFFAEACRTLRPGGRILMVEPWVSRWSTFIYQNFHPEPFLPEAAGWGFPATGPLSGANGAIPWIVFERDADRFRAQWPGLRVAEIAPFMPFRYLASGGISMRSLSPGWSFSLWKACEDFLSPWMKQLAMFAFIRLDRA